MNRRLLALGPAERRLLLAVLDPRSTQPEASGVLCWPAVLAAARASKLLPAVADRVIVAKIATPDAATSELLRGALHETAVYNSRLLAELSRCGSILQAAGIEYVVLKGAALIARHYPRVSMRHTVDLDVLVDPQRFDEAKTLLRASGCVDDPFYVSTLVGDGRSLAAAWPANQHACPPLKGRSGATLDLHHRIPASFYEAAGGFRGLLARSEPVALHGVTVSMCSARDLALHLCEHFAFQHHADPTDAPKLLCDLRAMFPAGPPWGELQAGSARQRASVALARCLYEAAFARAAGPLSDALRRVAASDPPAGKLLAELSHLRGHVSRLAFNLAHRPRYALRTVFPTRAYMAQHHRIDPSSPRIYALYTSRVFTTLLRPLWPGA